MTTRRFEPDNISVSLGAPSGYVIKFTNGLRAYLSGDTGLHSEMRTVVREYYRVNLAVINMSRTRSSPTRRRTRSTNWSAPHR